MRTAIILLNWNGADDTLACLDSLSAARGNFFVVVVDNASADDSVARISAWQAAHADNFPLHFLPEAENHGFAKGNNVGVRFAMQFKPTHILLLNNDTEVEPDFLEQLSLYAADHPDKKVLTPQINYFHDKAKVWFCGGHLAYGRRIVCYKDCPESEVAERGGFPVSFVSGCALFCTASCLQSDGNLLTERFFFGEEDYEFALRMQRGGVGMACVPAAKIYHKVGASRDKMSAAKHLGKDYAYYLGKLICCRLYYSCLSFAALAFITSLKSVRAFRACGLPFWRSLRLAARLWRDAYTKEGVGHEDFLQLMRLSPDTLF